MSQRAGILLALTFAYGFGVVPWAFRTDPRDAELERLRFENELLEVRLDRAVGDGPGTLNKAEDLRVIQETSQPSHMVVVTGGITPGQGTLTPGLSEDSPPDLP